MTEAAKGAPALVIGLVFSVLLAGCPSGSVTLDDMGQKWQFPDADLDSQVLSDSSKQDGSTDSQAGDGGQLEDVGHTPSDSFSPQDTQPPLYDTGITGVGSPCPCEGNLYCYNGICLARCTAPTDPCQSVSSCSAHERCVEMMNSGTWICLPTSLSLGDVCGLQAFCPNNTICGSYTTGSEQPTPQCLPLCSQENSSCGTDGLCVRTSDGCLFCSEP